MASSLVTQSFRSHKVIEIEHSTSLQKMTKVYVPFCVINCCECSEEAIKKGTNFFGWGMLYAIVKEKNSMEKPWYLLIPVPFLLIPGILQLFMTCESNPNRSDSSPLENHSQGPPHSMDMPASSGWHASSGTTPPKLDANDNIDSNSYPSLYNEDISHKKRSQRYLNIKTQFNLHAIKYFRGEK